MISLSILKFSTSNILTGYYQIINNHLNFALPAGLKEANLILSFDQKIQYSWVEEYRGEDEFNDNIISKTIVDVSGSTIEGNLIKEQIYFKMFGEAVVTQILLKVIPKDERKLKGAFSFAFKYDNEDFSLIHYLKKNNLISRLSYLIGYADLFKAGFVYFGGIQERATLNR